jgi:hypothetical protein
MKTGQAIPGGFAVIIENAQGAECAITMMATPVSFSSPGHIPKIISKFSNLDCENRWKNLKQLKSNLGKPPMSHV